MRRGPGLDLLDGVGERQGGDDGGGAVADGLDDRVHGVDGDQGAGRVVDEDGGDGVGEGVEAPLHGFLAGVGAGDDEEVGALGQGVLVEEVAYLGGTVGRRDDDDQGHVPGGGHGPYGVDEHGRPAERAERFGGAGAEPYAAAGRGDHGGRAVGTRLFRHRLHSEASACLCPRPTWVWPQASRAPRHDSTGTLSVTPGG